MMIFFTHDIFTAQKIGGVSRYFFELARQLEIHGTDHWVVGGLYYNESIRKLSHVKGIYLPGPRVGPLRRSVNAVFQKFEIPDEEGNVIHQTFFSALTFRKPRIVVTVYDMIDELFHIDKGNPYPSSTPKRLCCERAHRIIAISESTKADLIRLFQIDPEKITVVYLGNSISHISNHEPSKEPKSKPYLLHVGNRTGYKNFKRLLEAYAGSSWLKSEFDLLCFGGGQFVREEMVWIRSAGISNNIQYRKGDDRGLADYYRGASALIYPSCYEGFGLPLIEAMGMECPVICSRTSSMPEVAGDAAVYFDPLEVESIRSVLEQTLGDAALMKEMRRRGLERQARFTWEQCYEGTMAAYRKALCA